RGCTEGRASERNGPSKENQCKTASAVIQNMLGLSEFHEWRGFPRPEFLREKHGVSTVRYSLLNATIRATFAYCLSMLSIRMVGHDRSLQVDSGTGGAPIDVFR